MSKQLIHALWFSRYDEAFNLLLEGSFKKNSKTVKSGLTAMHLAAKNGYTHLLEIMAKLGFNINATSKRGLTPLHYAVMNQHVDATKALLALKADVDAMDADKVTPLHRAVTCNTSAGVAITEALLKAKANPNVVDRAKKSPLHEAVLANAYSQVRLLVQSKADPHAKDRLGCTPIEYATENKYTRIEEFLSKNYADQEASDTDSEDVTDYQFFDEGFSPSFRKHQISLSGNLDDTEIHFEEQWIAPNNDCAFIGLGTDRASLAETLRNNATENIRKLMWQEIAEAILTEIYHPEGVNDILDEYYANLDLAPEPLKSFSMREDVFLGYLDLLEDPDKKIWLGYHAAKVYASLKNIQLYIWTRNDDESLTLSDQNEVPLADQEIHLLHRDDYTHFNFLIKSETFEDKLDSVGSELSALSIDEKKQEFAIPHFRGVHFYKEHFTRQQRKQSIDVHRKQNVGALPQLGLYSSATYELAKAKLGLPETATDETLTALEDKLSKANQKVVNSMQGLQNEKQVDACLGRKKESREIYSSRYAEFVQRYVNSYQTLMEDMKAAPNKKIDGRTGKAKTIKWKTLKRFGFTKLPLLSTSETVYWGLEYASALLNWDKFGTHQPRNGAATVLGPCYASDGHPRFPYLGILYVTLHAHAELTDEISTRILDLFSDNEIDVKNSSPGGPLKGGYIKARERVFIGGVERDYVKLSLVIRVPSFYHDFRPFIQEKYGITEKEYNNFKNKLSDFGHRYARGGVRNISAFHETEQNIIQLVINRQQQIIEEKIKHVAEKENMICHYLGLDKTKTQTKAPELEDFVKRKEQSKKRPK